MGRRKNHIHIAIPSWHRADAVKTLQVFPNASIWCCESQADDYMRNYGKKRVRVNPDKIEGNFARKKNYILDHAPARWVLFLDDDIPKLGFYENSKRVAATPAQAMHMVQTLFEMADSPALKVRLIGINQSPDPAAYRQWMPFSTLAAILGPFNGHLSPELRYDERFDLREDYDFFLQNIHRHRRVLRFNKWHYFHDHATNPGGCTIYRTSDRQRDNDERLIRKWGIGKRGGSPGTGKGSMLNMWMRTPLRGA